MGQVRTLPHRVGAFPRNFPGHRHSQMHRQKNPSGRNMSTRDPCRRNSGKDHPFIPPSISSRNRREGAKIFSSSGLPVRTDGSMVCRSARARHSGKHGRRSGRKRSRMILTVQAPEGRSIRDTANTREERIFGESTRRLPDLPRARFLPDFSFPTLSSSNSPVPRPRQSTNR